MTRVVVVIPSRYASQRLPAKPLADICGKPMVQHVYERATEARRVDDVIVATDDERIEAVVSSFGGKAAMTPPSLQSGTDRIAYVASNLPHADIVVNVQGDEPLIAPAMIDEAIAVVAESEALVGTLVRKIEHAAELFNPNVVKVVLGVGGNCLYFSRSPIPFGRDLKDDDWLRRHTFYKHIGLYVFRRDFLLRFLAMEQTPLERAEKLEQLRVLEHGYNIKASVTTYDSMPVDTEEDLQIVRTLYRERNERE